ncbi:MAG: PIN domain-containing protein [Caldimonas sp.]
MSPAAVTALPELVLDTNVVLDWIFFRDPRTAPLAAAISTGQVRWLACAALRAELLHVLERGVRRAGAPSPTEVLESWDRWATMTEPAAASPEPRLRCTDPDDQKFIDFALQTGASALLSGDRAVLKLASRAARHGLQIVTAQIWQARWATDRSGFI